MTPPMCKLGLVLSEGLHDRMIAQATAPGDLAPRRGAVRAIYERAFLDLLRALDAGEPVTFAAVRGAKARATLRLPQTLCDRVRTRQALLNLKLTDLGSPHESAFCVR